MSADGDAIQKLFGERLRDRRIAANLSQERLAELAGLHRTYVSSAERAERNVSLINIVRLATALGIDPGQLVEGMTLEARPPSGRRGRPGRSLR